VVNHFTISRNEFPTIEEYITALSDEKVKYAVIDNRANFHLKDKWEGEKIENLYLSMDLK